jgi:hypothetical protein
MTKGNPSSLIILHRKTEPRWTLWASTLLLTPHQLLQGASFCPVQGSSDCGCSSQRLVLYDELGAPEFLLLLFPAMVDVDAAGSVCLLLPWLMAGACLLVEDMLGCYWIE